MTPTGDFHGLSPGELRGVYGRGLSGSRRRLLDSRRVNLEAITGLFEQLAATRRRTGQDQSRFLVMNGFDQLTPSTETGSGPRILMVSPLDPCQQAGKPPA